MFGESGYFLISSFLGHLFLPLVLKPQQGTIPSLKTLSASSSSSVMSEAIYSDSDSDCISDPLSAGKSESSSSPSAIIISAACSAENLFLPKTKEISFENRGSFYNSILS